MIEHIGSTAVPGLAAKPVIDSDEIERHLLFRGGPRENESDRRLYERVKRKLAGRRWNDVNPYAQAKSGVITEITARARAQQAS